MKSHKSGLSATLMGTLAARARPGNGAIRFRIAGCAEDQGAVFDPGQRWRALNMLKAVMSGDGPEIVAKRFRENPHLRTCSQRQLRAAGSLGASASHGGAFAFELEEDRKLFHVQSLPLPLLFPFAP